MTLKDESPRSEGVQYTTGEERRTTSRPRKNDVARPKQKWCSAVDVSGNESKIWCCKKQYCIGTWNVRSMNQGKLHLVKHEMLRITIGIVGISELKWTGMSEFNSDDHYIYYCGQESQRRNGVALIINKTVQNAVLGFNLKNDRMILISFQGKPFSITVIQVYPPTTDAEEPPYNPAIPLLAYPQTKILFKKIYAPLCSQQHYSQ